MDDENKDEVDPEDAISPSFTGESQALQRSHESIPPINSYQIKPSLQEKFKEIPVKEIIRNVISGTLSGRSYEAENVKRWTILIANEVNEKVKVKYHVIEFTMRPTNVMRNHTSVLPVPSSWDFDKHSVDIRCSTSDLPLVHQFLKLHIELQMKRYKHIVQVIIGEMKGAGVKSGVRCLWDSDVDGYTSEIFMNDTIFCITTVFAIYLY